MVWPGTTGGESTQGAESRQPPKRLGSRSGRQVNSVINPHVIQAWPPSMALLLTCPVEPWHRGHFRPFLCREALTMIVLKHFGD